MYLFFEVSMLWRALYITQGIKVFGFDNREKVS